MASSIKYRNKDYEVHFKLAALLEEKNFFENIYGKEKKDEVFHQIFFNLIIFFIKIAYSKER